MSSDAKRAWDKRDKETSASYAAFCTYLELGLGRTLLAAYRASKGYSEGTDEGPKTLPGNWRRWSVTHEWVARCEAYDEHELQRGLERRARTQEGVRQRYVDHAVWACDRLIRFAAGEVELTRDQIRVLEKIIDRAGVIVPRQVEISGRDGKPVQVATEATAKLDTETLRALSAKLAELRKG